MFKNGNSTAGERAGQDEQPTREQRQRALEAIERIGERNRDVDLDRLMADVTAAVDEVRQERYEADQRAKVTSGH